MLESIVIYIENAAVIHSQSKTPSITRSIPMCSKRVPAIHRGINAATLGPTTKKHPVKAAIDKEQNFPPPPLL